MNFISKLFKKKEEETEVVSKGSEKAYCPSIALFIES